jgi:hypothetical protein
MTELRDLIDDEGLSRDDVARLQRVHDLLVQAGPPAELPPELAKPSGPAGGGELLQFPLMPRRRWAAAAVAVAAAALAAFGGGYLFGHSKAKPASFTAARVVEMHPLRTGVSALAVLRVAHADAVGNWPMELTVTGLPEQTQRAAYYELWLTKNGKPALPCGTFRVHGQITTVRLSVPYSFKGVDGWVVTKHTHGQPEPGRVVLTT